MGAFDGMGHWQTFEERCVHSLPTEVLCTNAGLQEEMHQTAISISWLTHSICTLNCKWNSVKADGGPYETAKPLPEMRGELRFTGDIVQANVGTGNSWRSLAGAWQVFVY